MKVKVNHLTKKYGKKLALKDLNFTLEGPKIYGLLGRNGAGKTTFMNILSGQQFPTQGDIFIEGDSPYQNNNRSRQICLISEGDNFFKELRVKDALKAYRLFYPNWNDNLAQDMVRQFKLPLNSKVKALSKGMVSALGITVGLASRAEITIFDEPYIGMDAANRKMFYELLVEEMEDHPRSIVFSTHLIDEVSLLFEEVLIIQNGELILQKTADEMRQDAYAVSGNIEKVKAFIQDKRVLHQKQMAQMMVAYIYEPLPEHVSDELNIEGVPIQDLMVYLTDESEVS